MAPLKHLELADLDLVETTQEGTPMAVAASFPFSATFPGSSDIDLEGGHNVVYFEIPPGKELATHTDSPEEIVLCLAGHDIEATVAGETGRLAEGELVVIPPMAPHEFRNTGDSTAEFIGFFSDSTTVSEFEHDLEPFGTRVLRG